MRSFISFVNSICYFVVFMCLGAMDKFDKRSGGCILNDLMKMALCSFTVFFFAEKFQVDVIVLTTSRWIV